LRFGRIKVGSQAMMQLSIQEVLVVQHAV
jgi:hypothetical protein